MKKGFLYILILLSFYACKEEQTEVIHKPQPYVLVLPPGLPPAELPADNPLTKEGVALGRALFYDPLLSKNQSQSCASCHNQSFAFTDHGLAKSVGVRKMQGNRNSMPLFNLMLHNQGFFWDGRVLTLRQQALHPIQDTLEMDETIENVLLKLNNSGKYPELFKKAFGTADISAERIGLALEQFMLSIVSGTSRFDLAQAGKITLTESEKRGQILFFKELNPNAGEKGADCFHCHGGPDFSNHSFMNNGLDVIGADPGRYSVTGRTQDYGKFKTPSLRNIELSAPYMHDGRFSTLEEVIEHYNNGIKHAANLDPNMHAIKDGINLNEQDKTDLINFLKSLTDTVFLKNSEYAAPQ